MNFVVFDLEWNNGIKRSKYKWTKCPNEIIEIGAVKIINSHVDITNTFSRIIKPQIYRGISPRISAVTGFRNFHFKDGIEFENALDQFRSWCGDDVILCSWTYDDIIELNHNIDFLLPDHDKSWLEKYVIIQKLVMKLYNIDKGQQPSLKNIMSKCDIPIIDFGHDALGDAKNAARILLSVLNENNIKIESLIEGLK